MMSSRAPRARTRTILWAVTGALLASQFALAIWWISKPSAPSTSLVSARAPAGAALLGEARRLADDGQYGRALELTNDLRRSTGDTQLRRAAGVLSRQLRVESGLARAQAAIEATQYQRAILALEEVLMLEPAHATALELMNQADRALRESLDRPSPATAPAVAIKRAPRGGEAAEATVETDAKRPSRRSRHNGLRRGQRANPPEQRTARAVAEVGDSDETPAAQPSEGTIDVIATPPAALSIDGQSYGLTPRRALTLTAGRHSIVLKRSGMRSYRERISLAAGERKVIDARLKPLRKAPALSARTGATARSEPISIPRLVLPVKVSIPLYRDGKRTTYAHVVCMAVERVVSEAIGRSAGGSTRGFLAALYANADDDDEEPVTIYPRAMGYVIAKGLVAGSRGVSQTLARYQRSGRLAKLARSGWRP